jgi:hypothetical protein
MRLELGLRTLELTDIVISVANSASVTRETKPLAFLSRRRRATEGERFWQYGELSEAAAGKQTSIKHRARRVRDPRC